MKRIVFKFACFLISIFITLTVFVSSPVISLALNSIPVNIVNNFGLDPKTEHNFTWASSIPVKNGILEYCKKEIFSGFDKLNIIKVSAVNYVTMTDQGKRAIYKVELKNLLPGTDYVYRVGLGTGNYSSQGSFRTAEQTIDSFTFINITDTQGTTAKDYSLWKNTLDKALHNFPTARFLIHTGDMVDAGQYISQWNLFTGAVKSELLNLSIVPVVGNHEVMNNNKTNTDAKNFTDSFNLPKIQNTGAPVGTVYSFDYGNTHIAVMNTQYGSKNLKTQADWLKSDMSSTKKTWRIVALHRGPYGATYDTTDIRKAWSPIFDEVGIDLVLQGHDHNYVRSFPMKNKVAVKLGEGTIYMNSNTGGVKFYPQKTRSWQEVNFQPHTQMYLGITISNKKMYIAAYDIKNTLRDSVTLTKFPSISP